LSPATTDDKKNTWQIFFQGGGWCYNELDCLGRSRGDLGSSKGWGPNGGDGGINSGDCNVNPDFCTANRVVLNYCDGNSFSGMREDPLVVSGSNLWFRGRYNIDAALDYLKANAGLDKAVDVLLTGCSAGGLATFFHTDYVGDVLTKTVPTLKKYRSAPLSGYFLPHATVENKPIYEMEIKKIFEMSNATHGMNDACIASFPADKQYMCNFATETYRHIKYPNFVINSALDSWQTACIYTAAPVYDEGKSFSNGNCSAAPGWDSCGWDMSKCTTPQMGSMITYEKDFMSSFVGATTLSTKGNGAFIFSCHSHCASCGGQYNTIKIDGTTMQQAFSKWWASTNEDASSHTYKPCIYTSTKDCNPTC